MTRTEQLVAAIMAGHGRKLPQEDISADTAMAQDALIDGIDVDDFVADLELEFGNFVWEIPWGSFSDQRASFRGCLGVAGFPFWLIFRLLSRPPGEAVLPVVNSGDLPRLTVGHIAKVIDEGHWSHPPEL